MLVLDESHDHGSAEVRVGDRFQVRLYENPTTGRRWRLRPVEAAACRVLDDVFEASRGGYGGGGTRCWTFVADHAAAAALYLELRPGGQSQPARTFEVTINIKDR
jgi:predicted secreted protein